MGVGGTSKKANVYNFLSYVLFYSQRWTNPKLRIISIRDLELHVASSKNNNATSSLQSLLRMTLLLPLLNPSLTVVYLTLIYGHFNRLNNGERILLLPPPTFHFIHHQPYTSLTGRHAHKLLVDAARLSTDYTLSHPITGQIRLLPSATPMKPGRQSPGKGWQGMMNGCDGECSARCEFYGVNEGLRKLRLVPITPIDKITLMGENVSWPKSAE